MSAMAGRWPALLWAAVFCMSPLGAAAADNSHIVIIEQGARHTPYTQQHSRRRIDVYGPASGFRYEEYRYPPPGYYAPYYPRYRDHSPHHHPRHGSGGVYLRAGPPHHRAYPRTGPRDGGRVIEVAPRAIGD